MTAMNWDRLLSSVRLRRASVKPSPYDKRSSFDSDFDRVVFSSSFRRLQDKTQVFPLESHDFIRTRLTHSSEVAAIGRAMGISAAAMLKDQEKVKGDYTREWSTIISTACLLHDIGNPPFGHSGEKYISQWFQQKLASTGPAQEQVERTRSGAPLELLDAQEKSDLTGFEGNAHAFRVATRLQTLGDTFGMNLTCGTLAALLKYPCSSKEVEKKGKKSRSKFGYFKSDEWAFRKVMEVTGLPEHCRHPLVLLVEAADDIAYSIVDIEDALKKRIITFHQVIDYLERLDTALKKEFLETHLSGRLEFLRDSTGSEKHQLAFQHFRGVAVGNMIASCVETFCNKYDAIVEGSYESELTTEMKLAPLCRVMKDLGSDHVYSSSDVVKVEESGKHVIWGLLDIFYDELTFSPESRLVKTCLPPTPPNTDDVPVSDVYKKAQRVADYVAGMTDTFAMSLYKRLTGHL